MNYLRVSRLVLPAFFVIAFLMSSALTRASDETLDAVISNHWDWVLEQYPEYRREYGDMSGNQSWTDLSASALEKRNADTRAFIDDLSRIDPTSLSETSQLNQRMLKTALQEEVDPTKTACISSHSTCEVAHNIGTRWLSACRWRLRMTILTG